MPDIALVQVASGLDPEANRALVKDLPDADLVVFPEVFQRDFGRPGSDLSEYGERLDGPFVSALVEAASQGGVDRTVVAGMLEASPDPSRPYNTVVAVTADGVVAAYRKIHLYDSFGFRESDVTIPGDPAQRVSFGLGGPGGLRIGLITCYDLRFPELARDLAADIDLLLVPAAWVPGPRKVAHWRTLATARAIEDIAYVAAVGQPGPRYSGNSLVVSPRGDVIADAGLDPALVVATVDPAEVAAARAENPSLSNRRL